jgi:tRNA pseudouridine55 synthase
MTEPDEPTQPAHPAVLAVDKPTGPTSRRVVDQVGRLLPRGTRLGHAGTLDPAASGVLVLCLGAATRLIRHLHAAGKSYHATVRLGAISDTLDAEGTVVETPDATPPSLEVVRAAVTPLTGRVLQAPPAFSALKVRGERAYDLARRGESPELEPREVRIDRIEVRSYAWPIVELQVDCGSGTYIRSIARDLGEALGVGGLLQALRRTRVGGFTLADAVPLDELTPETLPHRLRPARDAVAHLPRLTLKPAQLDLVSHGRTLDAARVSGLEAAWDGTEIALLDPDGALAAIGRVELASSRLHPTCVLPRATLGRLEMGSPDP